ncbi:hypothetical protein [Flavobacterium sp.]|uniref:hypothetical protein n=1 Tax=Flavobacterium sp. TaxID=239 RepID=UPI00286D0EA5|nr:hypothetical protein [Flavobacterium sp.]
MATIQDIQFENDANGTPLFVKINLQKYGSQLEPFLKQIGVLEEKDDFDSEWDNAVTSEEFLKRAIDTIKKLPWKK